MNNKVSKKIFNFNMPGISKIRVFTFILVFFLIFGFGRSYLNKASADSLRIVAKKDYCIDLLHNSTSENSPVVLWMCDKTSAQSWTENLSTITHDDKYCLSVSEKLLNSKKSMVVQSCNNSANQVWLNSNGRLYNPNSEQCLTSSMGDGSQLVVDDCNKKNVLTWNAEDMSGSIVPRKLNCDSGSKEFKLSCYAIKEWETWVNGSNNHLSLLTRYTDNATYEQWCADFISFVYKESGYPFKSAFDGWDENTAVNIQKYNFTIHDASSGYIPKPGDVAYFDYNQGGHTEIVVSGGSHPTMIYGNSGRIDPQTGNGDMRANTITLVKDKGSLIYYLSPN